MNKQQRNILGCFLIFFSLAFISCKQEPKIIPMDKIDGFIEKNMIEIEGASIIGKTQSDIDFGTKEEFWYGTFITNRTVKLSSYCIGRYEVSWEFWNKVREKAMSLDYVIGEGQCGSDASESADDMPVTDITWYDAVVWCNALTEIFYGSTKECAYVIEGSKVAKDSSNKEFCEKIIFDTSKKGFRLPTEAEWELAARLEKEKKEFTTNYGTEENPIHLLNSNHLSGAKEDFNSVDACNAVAWNKNNSAQGQEFVTKPIGKLQANGIDAFDMSGNVCEWCYDYHAKIEEGMVENPIGPKTGTWKVTRGGYMKAAPIYCVCSYRCFLAQKPTFKNHDIGFRFACYK